MQNREFDLDVTFDEQDPDLSSMSAEDLASAVANLPESIRAVAEGILVQKRTMSDVSQALAIRQAELVSRLHRAKILIASAS